MVFTSVAGTFGVGPALNCPATVEVAVKVVAGMFSLVPNVILCAGGCSAEMKLEYLELFSASSRAFLSCLAR